MTYLPTRLLVVTDRKLATRSILETVRAAMDGGTTWIWLRDRDLPVSEREYLAKQLIAMMADRTRLTIGGDIDLAWRVGAQGVHLPAGSDLQIARARLGARSLIGVSAHSREDLEIAKSSGADYATLSPIFASASKPGYGPALGLDGLAAATSCGLPVLALGGITAVNAKDCMNAGAAGIAVMGGICAAGDPGAAAAAYVQALTQT